MATFYSRAGAAYGAGAPLGASVDVAKSTGTNVQAGAAGRRMSSQYVGGQSISGAYGSGGARTATNSAMAQSQDEQAARERVGQSINDITRRYVVDPVMKVAEIAGKPVNWLENYYEAADRTTSEAGRTGWWREYLGATLYRVPGVGLLDPEFRSNMQAANEANATVAQTAWLAIAGNADKDSFRLLDDPDAMVPEVNEDGTLGKTEREEYFSSGAARWVTGVADVSFDLFADPLVIAGKGASIARAARNTVKAEDVAQAAAGAEALGYGARRVDATVNRVVDASERVRGVEGGAAALYQTRFLGQTADAGAIPYFLQKADEIEDVTERVATKRDALFAGMGDRDALARLEKRNGELALELEAMNGPNRASAIETILSRRDYSHLENLRAADEDAFLDKVVDLESERIRSTMDSIQRVQKVGNPARLEAEALQATSGVGELAKLTDTAGSEFLRIGKTIKRGNGLPPVHVLTGRHIPGTFSLSSDDAFKSFNASLDEARRMFKDSDVADETFAKIADDFAVSHGAADPAAARATRREIVDRFNQVMEKNIAHRHGGGDKVREEQILTAIREIRSRRTAEMAHVQERAYRAARPDGIGYHQDADGVYTFNTEDLKQTFATPFDGTQLDDMVSLPSYRKIEKTIEANFSDGFEGFMRKRGDRGWEVTEEFLAVTNDLWKFASLLRVGYPIRVQVDTQARMLATLGPLRYMATAAKGTGNLAYNLRKVTQSEVELVGRQMQARAALESIAERYGDDIPDAVRTHVDELEKVLAEKPPRIPGDKKVRVRNTELARYVGKGEQRGSAYRSTADLQREIETFDARDSILGMMDQARSTRLSDMRASEHVQVVAGDNPRWMDSYLKMVNQRVRNSHPLLAMAAGESDEAIVNWYKTDAAGRAQWKALSHRYESIDDLVRTQREQLDTLLPDDAIRSQLAAGPLSETQVDEFWKAQGARPGIPAQMLEEASGNAVVQTYNKARSQWFRFASEMPENMLGRHPFFVDRKQMHLRRMIDNAGGDADALSIQQYNQAANRASVLARRDIGQYLFDTAQRSNMAHALRFVSPFFSAWSDTMVKWGRIIGENMEVAPIIPKVFQAPNNLFTVVDNDGNRIMPNGDVVDGEGNVVRKSADWTEGYILIGVPEWLPDWANPGGGDNVKINKGSLNVIFQGDPFWLPGPGPLAAIPANEIVKRAFPEAWDDETAQGAILRYILPYGLDEEGPLAQAMPMWAKNLKTAITADTDDDRFAQTYAMLMAETQNEVRRGELEPMSQAELEEMVHNKARNWWFLRVLGSQAPFSTQPTSRMEFWRQEWQRYQRTYGGEARNKFYEDYPDYFEASISLSANESGIVATDESWNETEKYLGEIKANPEYGWMYVGAANVAPGFDAGVYTAQKFQGLRSTKDPVDAFTDVQVNKGWFDYQKVRGQIDLKLEERKEQGGSSALSAKANSDLKAIWDEALDALKSQNAQWADAFEGGGSGGKPALQFLRQAAQATIDRPELAERSDFQALESYMQVRAVMQQKLLEREAQSLDAQSNEDLKVLWDEFTAYLRSQDIGFDQMYTRGRLDRDDLTGG